jgi:hypothetical protein
MIDHLVYATPDIEATVDELAERLGVRATPGGRHRGLGTWNALLGALGVELAIRPADAPALVAVIEGPAGAVELR